MDAADAWGASAAVLATLELVCVLHVDRKIRARGHLLMSLASMSLVVSYTLLGETTKAAVFAAFTAIVLWTWWNGGGGDGMRRRWKSLKQSLTLKTTHTPQTA